MDWKKLAGNRRVQLGAAAGAVGLGGIVWYRGKKAAAAPAAAAAGTGSDSSGSTVAGGFPNTSGSDLASILGNNAGSINDSLAGFTKTLTDIETQLSNMHPPATTGGPHPPIVVPKPKPITTPRSVPVVAFSSAAPAWNSTLSGIAKHEHTTVEALMKLNPSIKNKNVIRTGSTVRVA